MERKASRLADYCRDRLGDALRGVGYHTGDEYDIVHIRDDVVPQYPPERADRLVRVSRNIHTNLRELDEMGYPEASLHSLEDALLIQFHFSGDDVVFMAVDRDVGRNFTKFVDDCLDRID